MIVVADSSPLIALLRIVQIGILPPLFRELIVPPAVISELTSPKRTEEVRRIFRRGTRLASDRGAARCCTC
jgi:predicted nucleic acid-binding protein